MQQNRSPRLPRMNSRLILLVLALCSGTAQADDFLNSLPAAPAKPAPAAQQPAPADGPARERVMPPEQSWEPTPSPLAYASLWDRLRDNFSIPNLDSPLVREWEQYYAARPEQLYRISERGRRYMYHIVEELDKRSMPLDLALLPMIESAYNPRANSPAHASGIWQFVPSTGKHYGLEQTWWYDGRRDVLAATEAALDYLNYLNGLFGDWHLALASYNWGEGAVARALGKNRARGLPEDYSSIGLPNETLNYVPKLLAVRNLIANPEAYGIRLPNIPNRPFFSVVTAPHHMDTQVAAKLAGMTLDEFTSLNPAFNKPIIAYKPSRRLLVPADKEVEFSEKLSTFDGPLLSWQQYPTTPGESYDKIASRFGTTVAKLRELNNIGKARVARGETLMVPRAGETTASASDGGTAADAPATNVAAVPEYTPASASIPTYTKLDKVESARAKKYTVRKGDTVYNISRRYDLSVAELVTINHLKSHHLHLGQPLTVARLEQIQPAGGLLKASYGKSHSHTEKTGKTIHHTARRGETVYSIARKYDVSVQELQHWNKFSAKRHLKAGDVIQIRDQE